MDSGMVRRPLIAELDDLWPVNAARYLIAATAIVTNAFLVALIAGTRQLRQSKFNCYILVLAIGDLVAGQSVQEIGKSFHCPPSKFTYLMAFSLKF